MSSNSILTTLEFNIGRSGGAHPRWPRSLLHSLSSFLENFGWRILTMFLELFAPSLSSFWLDVSSLYNEWKCFFLFLYRTRQMHFELSVQLLKLNGTRLGISRLNSIVQALCAFIRGLNLFFMTEIQCCISSNRISRAGILEQRASWIDPVSTRCFSTSICSEFFISSLKANLFWKLSSLNVVRIARIILSKLSAILKCSLVDNRRTQRVFAGSKMRISRAKWPGVKLHLPCDTFSRCNVTW